VQLKNTKVKVFELASPATQTELLGDFDFEDMKGVSIMKVEDIVKVAVKAMQTDRFEIRPGQVDQLKMMSRVAAGAGQVVGASFKAGYRDRQVRFADSYLGRLTREYAVATSR
jgi:short-subunit dehydrogenase